MSKFNTGKRGGLSVDRDSLHASPQYREHLTAAQRLEAASVRSDEDDTKHQLAEILAEMKRANALFEILLQQGQSFSGPR